MTISFRPGLLKYVFLLVLLLSSTVAHASSWSQRLFDYQEVLQPDMNYVGQWLNVLERHITEDVPESNCTKSFFNRCHLKEWYAFLDSVRDLPPQQQVSAVNKYVNQTKYIMDINNYGVDDYWAVAREFFYNGGDCEDYAITKFFSLRMLGHDPDTLRIVVLQDTNLRVPHAVLAVFFDNDVLIMDNQTQEVVSHRQIVHYIPLFSVDEKHWWLHLPAM